MTPVYVGIDVACAKRKRLPICFASFNGDRFEPIQLSKELERSFPVGLGNREILENTPFRQVAEFVAVALKRISNDCGWHYVRIAIDAPAAPPETGGRRCEEQLAQCGIPVFQTPDDASWDTIIHKCRSYLSSSERPLSALPYANKIWMLYGFELYRALRNEDIAELIEVYPYAIVRTLLSNCPHKSTQEGYMRQLKAISDVTGWFDAERLEGRLARAVSGSKHDRLDAYMAAWVASLHRGERTAFGEDNNLDDAIWVPAGTSPGQRPSV